MSTDSVGTARIDIVVDTSQFDSAIDRAKNRTASMSNAAQQEYAKLDRVEKRRIDRLIDTANTVGMTREQQIVYNAALKTSGSLLDDITRKVAQNTTAVKTNGVSLAQLTNAQRQLPMQFTDIFTSLASGQKPLQVLLQQGGQLKDTFGGIGPALNASAGYVMGLINPLTLATAAAAGLALAWKEANDAQFEIQKTLLTTGNYAGMTAADVQRLIDRLDSLDGVARGSASTAVLQVAQSGRFAGEQFRQVAESAARMESAVGTAVDDTVAKFAAIAKDPVAALLKLNETEHFLTRAQYERVAALKEEGKEQAAVAEATRLYSDHLNDVAGKAEQHKTAISGLWSNTKDEITGAWRELGTLLNLMTQVASIRMPNWFGADGFVSQAASSLSPLTRLRQVTGWYRGQMRGAGIADFSGVNSGVASSEGGETVDSGDIQRQMELEKEWGKLRDQNLSQEQRRLREINEARELGKKLKLDEAKIEEQVAAINARYAAKKQQAANTDNSSAQSLIDSIRRQITANEQLASTGEKVSASDRLGITARQMLAESTNTMTGSTRKLLQALLPQLKASDDAAEAMQRQVKAAEALSRQNAILAGQSKTRERANELDLMQYGRGTDAVEQLRRQLDIQREYQDELKRIGSREVADDRTTWDQLAANAARHRDEQLDRERQYQQDRLAILSDWRNGAMAAAEDYLFEASNAAAQAGEMVANSFKAAEDAFVQLAKTGKLSFSDFADSVIADLGRIAAKQALTGLYNAALTALTGGVGGVVREVVPNAKGGIYNSASLSAYSGKVVDKPTLFAFAKGAGLMGEAGPEAILPLRRGSDGKLGVQAAVGGGNGIRVEVVNNGAPATATATSSRAPDGSQLIKVVLDAVAGDMAGGGRTAAAVRSRFGLRESV